MMHIDALLKTGEKNISSFPHHVKAIRQNHFKLPQRVQFPIPLNFITIIYSYSEGMQSVSKLVWFHLTPDFTLHRCKLIAEVQSSGELGFKAENFAW